MALVLTIGGVTKTFREGSLHISQTANGRSTASFTVVSTDGTYRPALDDEVILTLDGDRIFGGLVDQPRESGTADGFGVSINTHVSAVDFNSYVERRIISIAIPAGTLAAALDVLVDTYLADYGVTLDAGQVAGPWLPLLGYTVQGLRAVLDDLAKLTLTSGTPYTWRIDHFKVLSMAPAGGTVFVGAEEQFLIQQAEYYRYVPEGDTRLMTYFTGASLDAYAVIQDNVNDDYQDIIGAFTGPESTAFYAGYADVITSGQFAGSAEQFLIYQMELYRYAEETDPRLKTFFEAASVTAYDAVYASIEATLTALINTTLDAGELAAFNDGYDSATTGFVSGPFNISGLPIPEVIGDITVEEKRAGGFANNVTVWVPPTTQAAHVETFAGDGEQTEFTLDYTIAVSRGYVTNNAVVETLGNVGDGATWEYDAVANTITRTSAPAVDADISIEFDGTFTAVVNAYDLASINDIGIWDKVLTRSDITSVEQAQALAYAELTKSLRPYKTVKYKTMEAGLLPGMAQSIVVPRRNLDTTGIISDIVTRDIAGRLLIREVTVVIDGSGTNLDKGWRDTYRQWRGDNVGSGQTPPVAPTQGPGTTPSTQSAALPFTAVQFNRSGAFGGVAHFTFQEGGNNLVVGTDSTITATDADSCFVFGSNCHVADP